MQWLMLRCSLAVRGGLRLLDGLDKEEARGKLDVVQRKEGVPANSAKLVFWRAWGVAHPRKGMYTKFGKIKILPNLE